VSELYVKKSFGKMEAADEASYEIMKKFKHGEVYKVKIWKPRNIKFHRKFFALLNSSYDIQNKYNTFEAYKYEVLLRAGHYEIHTTLKGVQVPVIKSLKFSDVDDIQFEEIFSNTIDAILNYFIPEMPEDDLRGEVQRILDFV